MVDSFTNIRAVAFDLDGTLIDSAPGLNAALEHTFAELQLPVPGIERLITLIGNGVVVLINRTLTWALGHAPEAALEHKALQLFNQYYETTSQTGVSLYPDVISTLEALIDYNVPLALVTNKPNRFIAPLLASFNIDSYFSFVVGGDDVAQKKPHPAGIFLVLGHFFLLPQQLLFVGDSRNDIQAAQGANVPSAGVSWGYNYGESIALSRPDVIFDRFSQLLPALGFVNSRKNND